MSGYKITLQVVLHADDADLSAAEAGKIAADLVHECIRDGWNAEFGVEAEVSVLDAQEE